MVGTGWVLSLGILALPAPVGPARADDVRAARLLGEALTAARAMPERPGGRDPRKALAVFRIADTMRLHGLEADANAAFRECVALSARLAVPAVRDELVIELCRVFTLTGRLEEAQSLAKGATLRNYAHVSQYVIARTLLEQNRATEAEAAIRAAPALTRSPKTKGPRHDDTWTRAFVRLAVRMGRPELARKLIHTMADRFWRSAAMADLCVALVHDANVDEALKTAAAIADPHMAVLAYARLAAACRVGALAQTKAAALGHLRKRAAGVTGHTARDAALRIAAGIMGAAGMHREAERLASDVVDPCYRVLALCEALPGIDVTRIVRQIDRCPASDRALLAEAVTVACAKRGLTQAALVAAAGTPPGWPRLRTLCEAARHLAERDATGDAAAVVDAAAACVQQIDLPGWRVLAQVRLALHDHAVGRPSAVTRHLEAAATALTQVTQAEVRNALVPRIAEAAMATGCNSFAQKTIVRALENGADRVLRGRLVPMLVSAGQPERALAECARQQLGAPYARRVMVYRLAVAGRCREALEYARKLGPYERAEALSDIALAQRPRREVKACDPRVVGVTLHGSWGSWFPRLERMGLEWELMPFSAPYELGARGLKARYTMLGYPGTGGHITHVAVVGAEAVREYLHAGGGFVGICAGQYLATQCHFVTCGTHRMCGQGPHQVQMRHDHPIGLHLPPVVVIPRRNGGMLIPQPGCEVIGWYDTIGRYAALVAGHYGLGRVVVFSPHPEGSSGFIPRDVLCINATNWAIGGMP